MPSEQSVFEQLAGGALVNGKWQDRPTISISDSAVSYGLSVFETMRVANGDIPLLAGHIARLSRSLATMCIPDGAVDQAMADIGQLLSRWPVRDAVIRLTVTAGESQRGYQLKGDRVPGRIVQLFPLTEVPSNSLILGVATTRLASNSSLGGVKHGNRIEQVLARQELQLSDKADDLLLLDYQSNVIESIASNLLVIRGDDVSTPALTDCGVRGVMRDHIMQRFTVKEVQMELSDLLIADEFILTNALGVRRVSSLITERDEAAYQATAIGDQIIGALPW